MTIPDPLLAWRAEIERRLSTLESRAWWQPEPVADRASFAIDEARTLREQLEPSTLVADLAAMTAERDEAQSMAQLADQLVAVLGSVAGDGGVTEGAVECVERIIRERDALQADVTRLRVIQDGIEGQRDAAREITRKWCDEVVKLGDERDAALARLDEMEESHGSLTRLSVSWDQHVQVQAALKRVIAERDSLKARLDALVAREPTEDELREMSRVMDDTAGTNRDAFYDGFAFVRDALLSDVPAPPAATEASEETAPCRDCGGAGYVTEPDPSVPRCETCSPPTLGAVCSHGSLARSCYVCELEALPAAGAALRSCGAFWRTVRRFRSIRSRLSITRGRCGPMAE